jgi:hypothetical protein
MSRYFVPTTIEELEEKIRAAEKTIYQHIYYNKPMEVHCGVYVDKHDGREIRKINCY